MGHVVAVVGLKREAAVLRGLDVVTVAGGGDPEKLRGDLALAAEGADGIISFGMAGALDPALRIGDWVLGERVGDQGCDPRWIAALRERLPQARVGPVHADGQLIAEAAEKLNLYGTSGCAAADMESHLAASAAAEAGLPFAILRCVSDEAGASLPPAVAVAMKPGGGVALGAVLGSILGNPQQLPRLIRTIGGFNRAFGALKSGAAAAGERLSFDER
jgi:hopanoid-associated phosphorylase